MPSASEIDEIFASTSKKSRLRNPTKPVATVAAHVPTTAITTISKPKKKKSKKSAEPPASTADAHSAGSTDQNTSSSARGVSSDAAAEKRRLPETVLDPSRTFTSKRRRIEASSSGGGAQLGRGGKNVDASSPVAANSTVEGVGIRKGAFKAGSAPDDDIDRFRDSRGTGPSCVSILLENCVLYLMGNILLPLSNV